jgi:hypothetical protein
MAVGRESRILPNERKNKKKLVHDDLMVNDGISGYRQASFRKCTLCGQHVFTGIDGSESMRSFERGREKASFPPPHSTHHHPDVTGLQTDD